MLKDDPIVLKYPQYLPTEEEVDLAMGLLSAPENAGLLETLSTRVAIAGCARSAVRRLCWQARQDLAAREDGKRAKECAEGALEWLKRCVAVRERLRMDSLLPTGPFSTEFRDLYTSVIPFTFHGVDKQGHPLYIARYGNVDMAAFAKLWAMGQKLQEACGLAVNGVVLYHLRAMEYVTKVVMAQESQKRGRVVDRMLVVLDWGGLGLQHLSSTLKEFLSGIAKESTPLFPETMHATILSNMPWLVSNAVWPIVKSFLHPVTQAKFTVLSSAKDLNAKMLELVDAQNVPPYFGGTCCCDECTGGKLYGGSLRRWEEERGAGSPQTSEDNPRPAEAQKTAETTENPVASALGS